MGMLRVISKRGDNRLHWNEQDALAGDAEAMAAIQEAERIFARERARGATAFRVEPGKPVDLGCGDVGLEIFFVEYGTVHVIGRY